MGGVIRIFTGNGKGKTTSALGLVVLAMGEGSKVFIGQFLKSGNYSEFTALDKFKDQLTVEHYGAGRFVKGKPSEEDHLAGKIGYGKIHEAIVKGEYDLVVIDEGNMAVEYGIISEHQLLSLFELKPGHVDLIVTGRGAAQSVMDKADEVIELKEIKHYYSKGVKARVGIER
ncbi:MAG: cob(I)yrinic acid a,c-diamide adenosyltransferase [Desulfobacterales bacterium]|nr:cob(I)yrinic acid a,c-diamide adenosyltransferase [Desulfobacterales bacterium]